MINEKGGNTDRHTRELDKKKETERQEEEVRSVYIQSQ